MSTLKVGTIQNASGVEVYTAKAWVNFNGTGTVAIRASGNVSSITDNGTGDYTVNFTTALPDANYAAVFGSGDWTTSNNTRDTAVSSLTAPTTSALRVVDMNGSATAEDHIRIQIAIFR